MKTIYEQKTVCVHLRQVLGADNRTLYEAGLSGVVGADPDVVVVMDDPLTIGERYVLSVSKAEREELS